MTIELFNEIVSLHFAAEHPRMDVDWYDWVKRTRKVLNEILLLTQSIDDVGGMMADDKVAIYEKYLKCELCGRLISQIEHGVEIIRAEHECSPRS